MDERLEQGLYVENRTWLERFIREGRAPWRGCEYDHSRKTVVCKHYLMDRCYRADECQYAHEIVPELMPDCKFYADCTDYFCHFRHQDDEELKRGCLDFFRGVELGECKCGRKGDVARLCPSYAAGFCPAGPACPLRHPRYDQPINRTEITSQVAAPCLRCGRFHLAQPRRPGAPESDVWVNNSCSVRFRCRHEHGERPRQRLQQLFKIGAEDVLKAAYEAIREIREDERRQAKLRAAARDAPY